MRESRHSMHSLVRAVTIAGALAVGCAAPISPPSMDAGPTGCGNACGDGTRCVLDRCVATNCPGQLCNALEVCVANACTSEACVGVICAAGSACAGGACHPLDCSTGAC